MQHISQDEKGHGRGIERYVISLSTAVDALYQHLFPITLDDAFHFDIDRSLPNSLILIIYRSVGSNLRDNYQL